VSSPTPTAASTRMSYHQYQHTIHNLESTTPDHREAAADQLADLLRRLRTSFTENNRQQLTGPGLSPTQSTLLRLVRTRPGITFAEARRSLRLTQRALRVHIIRLILAGLLERQQDSRSPSTLRLYPTALTHTWAATSLENRRDPENPQDNPRIRRRRYCA
jgi:DNA-binding MarR family transcriptional regulator